MSGGILLANTAGGLVCLGVLCLPVVVCATMLMGGVGFGIYASNCRTRDVSRCRSVMFSASAAAFAFFTVVPTVLIFVLVSDALTGQGLSTLR